MERRQPLLAGGRRSGEGDPAEHRVDGDVRVGGLRLVDPGPGRRGIVGEVADAHARDRVGSARVLGLEQEGAAGAVEVAQVLLREPARQRDRQIDRLRDVRDLGLGPARVEERLVGPERVEAVAQALRRIVGVHERRAHEPQRLHAPEEEADVLDVVAAGARRDPAHLGGVCERVESAGLEAARELEHALLAQVAVACAWSRDVVHELRRRQQLEELHRACRPAGDVARQLLEHRHGALAAPVADRVGDLGARRGDVRQDAVQRPVADQVADVRRHPAVGGLDELVVVELLDALREHVDLLGDDVDELAQHAALLGVADPVDARQQPVELLRRVQAGGGHVIASSSSSGSAWSSSRPAAIAVPSGPTAARCASRRSAGPGVPPL